jgi:hypothetical protein
VTDFERHSPDCPGRHQGCLIWGLLFFGFLGTILICAAVFTVLGEIKDLAARVTALEARR